jgi:hypothetical protein
VEKDWRSKPLEEVGVIGLAMGLDDGESLCSFDRIFFRKPSVGIERDPGGGRRSLVSRLGSTNSKPEVNSAPPTGEGESRRSGGQRGREGGKDGSN